MKLLLQEETEEGGGGGVSGVRGQRSDPDQTTEISRQVKRGSVPAHGGDGLSVLEAAESSCVVQGLHENLGQLLLVLGALVLLLPVLQQHVDL